MYKHTKKILALLIIAALLICTGCSNSTNQKTPSNYAHLHALIGKSVSEVCETLSLDEAEVTATKETRLNYALPDAIEFAGITWEVQLLNNWADGNLYGIKYVRSYTNDAEQASRDTLALTEYLVGHYGEPAFDGQKDSPADITLEELLARDKYGSGEAWELKDDITAQIQALIDKRNEEDPEWNIGYTYNMILEYTKSGEETAMLSLEYRVAKRTGVTIVTPRE